MTLARRLTGDDLPRRGVEVRDRDGGLLPRIAEADADLLIRRAWAEWIGIGTRRHLRLTDGAPIRQLPRGRTGVRRARADQTCRTYADGQAFGDRRTVEHIPIPYDRGA